LIPEKYKKLPLVVRLITSEEGEFMGGPKS